MNETTSARPAARPTSLAVFILFALFIFSLTNALGAILRPLMQGETVTGWTAPAFLALAIAFGVLWVIVAERRK